ncbi:MAG: phosphoethanolamine transferase [Paludibacteraceae bacterium]|nr:phosphoethanolamine transferase [Paludibacteraceae bacterium]
MIKSTKTRKITKQHIILILLSVIILLPNILACFLANNLGTVWNRLFYLLCSLIVFLIPALIFRARTFLVLNTVTICLGLFEMVHLITNKATTSLLFVYTILISEPGEALELISSGWPVILLYLLLLTGYFFLIFKVINNDYLFQKKTRIILAATFSALFLGSFGIWEWLDKKEIYLPEMPIHNESVHLNFVEDIEKVFPLDVLLACHRIIVLNHAINTQKDNVSKFSFGIQPSPNDSNQQTIIVLVIGETARYGNFGINGYHRNTTPKLAQRKNLISFTHTYSIANLTTVSVPFILSRATPQTINVLPKEKSVVDAFAEAGYETCWFANQSFGNKLLMSISNACTHTAYLPVDVKNHSNLDMNLLQYLIPIEQDNQQKKFIVLHTLGCHFKYNCRYPSDFAQFKPDMNGDIKLQQMLKEQNIHSFNDIIKLNTSSPLFNEVRELLVNSYDNAILYTDAFLDSTITILESAHQPAVLLYLGDHGENLLDDERNMLLHATYHGSIYEYHIPMMIWVSDEYKQKYAQKYINLQSNKDKNISSMTVFHSLLDLGNIQYETFDSTLSIASTALHSDSILWGLDANMKLMQIPTQR